MLTHLKCLECSIGIQFSVCVLPLKCGSMLVMVFLSYNKFIMVEALSWALRDWSGVMGGVLRKWIWRGSMSVYTGALAGGEFRLSFISNVGILFSPY
jgi:hypothetical protein